MKAQKSTLLILNYHHVNKHDAQGSLYDVSLQQLLDHLKIIKENSVAVSSLANDETYLPSTDFKLALTFDDGNQSDYDLVAPILKEYNYSAAFFALGNYLNKPGRLTSLQLRELSEAGHCVGSHGLSHEILTKLSPEQQLHELKDSKEKMEEIIGKEVKGFAFPYGQSNAATISAAKTCGYTHLFSTGMRTNLLNAENEIFYRWNITSKTDPELFSNVISSKAEISPASELKTRLQKNAIK